MKSSNPTNRRRLDQALAQVRSSPSSSAIAFSLHFEPFQLNADFPETADKQEWYLHNKHNDNPDAQKIFQAHMASLAEPLGVAINFNGEMANTLHAHRVIQIVQEENGAEAANRLVDALYRKYFTEAKHPSASETLVEACVEAGVGEEEAKKLVEDQERGERDVKQQMRMIAMDVDAVPVVMFEGKRRDITLTGAKEVADYVKALETVTKEST